MGIVPCFLVLFWLAFGLSLLVGYLVFGDGCRSLAETFARLRSRLTADRDAPPSLLRDEAVSAIPALNRALGSWLLWERIQRVLDQADIHVRPASLFLGSLLLAGFAGYTVSALHNNAPLLLIFAAAGGAATLPALWILSVRHRRFARFEAQLPEALAMMAGALQAGNALTDAIERVARELRGPVAVEFRNLFAEQSLGVDLGAALRHLAERLPLEDVHFFAAAVRLQREAGGHLAELLYGLADTIRARFQIRRQVRTLSAEGRLTGQILMLMPLGAAVIMYFGNRDYLSLFWTEKIGRMLLWTLLVSQLLGFLFIRQIVRIRV